MTHYYEKNIVDIKKEYTDFLVTIITPFLYEGFQSMYQKAKLREDEYIEAAKSDPNVVNPGTLTLFQFFLKGMPKLNAHMIESETNRIRDLSQCSDIFDDLIKATIKSNIVLLTYNASGKTCRLVNEKFHQTVDAKTFVHKCYVECARIFYDHAELFWHDFASHEIKHNQRVIYQLIRCGIIKAIRLMLPMKMILTEYLNNDYIVDENEDEHHDAKYANIKELIRRDLGNEQDAGGIKKMVDTTDSDVSSIHNRLNALEQNDIDLNDFIYGRKADETINELEHVKQDVENIKEDAENVKQEEVHVVSQVKEAEVLAGGTNEIKEPDPKEKEPVNEFIEGPVKKTSPKGQQIKHGLLYDAIRQAKELDEKKAENEEYNISIDRSKIKNEKDYFESFMKHTK